MKIDEEVFLAAHTIEADFSVVGAPRINFHNQEGVLIRAVAFASKQVCMSALVRIEEHWAKVKESQDGTKTISK